ncbi:hypothetical protein JCM10450v2_002816 [Rhodotorula kratochvilovae]
MESLEERLQACSISSDAPTTIHHLPEELIASILANLDDDPDTLKSCALVHSSFRDPAQQLLWAAVELTEEDHVRQFVATRARRRAPPKVLHLHAFKTRKGLARLFDGCAGLRELMIATPNRDVDPAILAHSSLEDLRTLIVQGWLHKPQSNLVLPFRLRSLVLADLYPGSPHFAAWLTALARTCLPSLQSIALPACSSAAHPAVAAALVPFAPHLRHLGLSIAARDDAAPYTDVLDAARALNSLECTTLPSALLPHLPLSLTVLATTEDARNIPAAELGAALERNTRLERMYFACSRDEFLRDVAGAKGLLETAAKRGIDWRFGGEDEE